MSYPLGLNVFTDPEVVTGDEVTSLHVVVLLAVPADCVTNK